MILMYYFVRHGTAGPPFIGVMCVADEGNGESKRDCDDAMTWSTRASWTGGKHCCTWSGMYLYVGGGGFTDSRGRRQMKDPNKALLAARGIVAEPEPIREC